MKKIGKTIAAFTLALTAVLCLGMTASAELWGEEIILEYAEYCKTHSYKQQISMYFEIFQADDGGG
ncbi:MAG: hypothetical protein K2N29_03615, partial [Ruminiclostridium sp.]|nr:hypothetical protein [Ruminiclostridium sp.]